MYAIEYTALAWRQLSAAPDLDRSAIIARIAEIQVHPYRTRAMKYNLATYRRAKAAGRYRIFFTVDENSATVRIAFIGIRMPGAEQDVYNAFERRLQENRL